MKVSISIKIVIVALVVIALYSLSSCTKCYTCQAYELDNRIDFNKECGTEQEKQLMEDEFRAQYPDSVYMVTCN